MPRPCGPRNDTLFRPLARPPSPSRGIGAGTETRPYKMWGSLGAGAETRPARIKRITEGAAKGGSLCFYISILR